MVDVVPVLRASVKLVMRPAVNLTCLALTSAYSFLMMRLLVVISMSRLERMVPLGSYSGWT